MKETVQIYNKPVKIELTPKAQVALQNSNTNVLAEMELYFSCLVRKKTRFYHNSDLSDQVHVADGLHIRFRPIMTQSCSIDETDNGIPPVTDFPVHNPAAFVPHWLVIDFKNKQWTGEFGYTKK